MGEKTYRLILEDRLAEGRDTIEAAARLCLIFKLDPNRAVLFGRGRILVKTGLDYWNAKEMENAVLAAGCFCRLEEETSSLEACLNCGLRPAENEPPFVSGRLCPRCGIILGESHLELPSPYPPEEKAAPGLAKKFPGVLPYVVVLALVAAFAAGQPAKKAGGYGKLFKKIFLSEKTAAPPPFSLDSFSLDVDSNKGSRGRFFPETPEKQYEYFKTVYVPAAMKADGGFEGFLNLRLETLFSSKEAGPEEARLFLLNSVCMAKPLLDEKLISTKTAEKLAEAAALLSPINPGANPFATDSLGDFLSSCYTRACPVDSSGVYFAADGKSKQPRLPRKDLEILIRLAGLEYSRHEKKGSYTADIASLIKENGSLFPDAARARELVSSFALAAVLTPGGFELALEIQPGRVEVFNEKGYAGWRPDFSPRKR